jgi:hypothetical protein
VSCCVSDKMSGKKKDDYLQRMETAVSNAHTAMKLLKDENSKLKERVAELEKKLLRYENERQMPLVSSSVSPLRPLQPVITRENPKPTPLVKTTDLPKKNLSLFARPNFAITSKGKDESPVIPIPKKPSIEEESKSTSRNQKRER